MKHYLAIMLSLMLPIFLLAQNSAIKPKPVQADCKFATKISVYKSFRYGPNATPDGYGDVQEITSSNKLSTDAFAKEHNTAWYILTCGKNADLSFKIVPIDPLNDYDFLLYKITDSNYCNNIKSKKLLPIRSNLSRVNSANAGITGLDNSAKNAFTKAGPGPQFSEKINIKKGEQYLLVIDNVYDHGNGFYLDFELSTIKEIKGIVTNENGEPIVAEVSLSDTSGNIIVSTTSNPKGEYNLTAQVDEKKPYQLSIVSKNTFFETIPINPNRKETIIKTQLLTLKKDTKYKVGQINFFPNSDIPLPEANVSIINLVKLMQSNNKLVIEIEGHVNGTDVDGDLEVSATERHDKLSVARAEKIASYLTAAGINSNRLSTVGYGSKQMLFPKAKTEKEQLANRRVEIKITSLNGD